MNQKIKIIVLFLLLVFANNIHAQTSKKKSAKTAKKTTTAKTAKTTAIKLSQTVFFQLIDSVDLFEVDHATEFKHIDVPKRMYNQFTAYIKDSIAMEIPGLKSFLYYHYTLKNGQIIIGDIYWDDKTSYIVFKIYDKKYVNYFTKEGVEQLKTLFKL